MLLAQAGADVLDYRVMYRGMFSGGADMPIADLLLETRIAQGSRDLRQARIEASSVAYPLVETLFPVRYRFRNWTIGDQGQLLGFENYESTRKVRHRLYLRDDSSLGVRRFDLKAGAGWRELEQLEAGAMPVPPVAGERLLDRLGLLQLVRGQNLADQSEYRFVVTNGRERLVYDVRVVAAQTLDLAGVSLPAWKLRFDGLESSRNGGLEPAHRPVYVWLSQTPEHIPLRVDSRHAIGRFRVELKNRPLLRQIAEADS
jgi:hypothetical protein